MNKRTLFAGMLFAAVLFSGCGDGVADSSDMSEASRGEISGVVSAERIYPEMKRFHVSRMKVKKQTFRTEVRQRTRTAAVREMLRQQKRFLRSTDAIT